jgi:hypothetical protein
MVLKAPLAGGAPTILASGLRYPYQSAVDGAAVYWIESDANCTARCATSKVMKVAK